MPAKQVRAQISGRVQGVGFRYYTQREAERLHLTGWVRNLPGGDVELVAEGAEDEVRSLLEWCHQGPPSASVTSVRAQWCDATGEHAAFSIRH